MKPPILAHYDQHAASFAALAHALADELRAVVHAQGLQVHSITHRVKPRDSLRYKLSRPERSYDSLWDVTDVIGLRVTTYFEDTVEAVAAAVERRFQVDLANSVDKRRLLGQTSFGYRSVHYICTCDPALLPPGLPKEPGPGPGGVRFEIQIRTILQHAWAEIEHDLGYKSQDALPEHLRRRFSRLASLLELVDEEFLAIRTSLSRYADEVDARLRGGAPGLPLDRVSLLSFVREAEVAAVDGAIAALLGKSLGDEAFFADYLLKMLRLSGLQEIADVRAALVRDQDAILRLVPPYFDFAQAAFRLTKSSLEHVPRGYSLFFLSHLRVLDSPMRDLSKVERMAQFYQALDYPDDPREAQRVASQLLRALRGGHGPGAAG